MTSTASSWVGEFVPPATVLAPARMGGWLVGALLETVGRAGEPFPSARTGHELGSEKQKTMPVAQV
jgi:hypothetical protein